MLIAIFIGRDAVLGVPNQFADEIRVAGTGIPAAGEFLAGRKGWERAGEVPRTASACYYTTGLVS